MRIGKESKDVSGGGKYEENEEGKEEEKKT